TITALARLLTYGGFFWLCLQTLHTQRRADCLLSAIAIAAGIYSLYGLLMHLSGARLIFWYPKWDHIESVTGTFPNRNHFATFTGLGLLCALAWLAGRLEAAGTPKRWIDKLLHAPRLRDFAVLAAVPICLAAVVLSLSRAGLVGTLLACVVFVAGLVFRTGSRGLWAGFAFLAVAGTYLGLGVGGTFDRIAVLLDPEVTDVRFPAYRQILSAIADNPWLGVGYGAFEDAFKAYRAPPLEAYFDVAHSTYLENALELGLPAAIALWLSIGWLALACLHGFLRRHPGWLYGWTAACATLLVGTHAALDFSLQIPAVAIAYTAILATGCSQIWRGTSHRTNAHYGAERSRPDLRYFDKAT
ncbi:MAG: O-antigen ligase family protein, partial [Pseudomonadota bacterium]